MRKKRKGVHCTDTKANPYQMEIQIQQQASDFEGLEIKRTSVLQDFFLQTMVTFISGKNNKWADEYLWSTKGGIRPVALEIESTDFCIIMKICICTRGTL